jgi:hypothetical protein
MTTRQDTPQARPRNEDPDPKTSEVVGTLLGVAYMLGLPLAFIVVEVLAALALTGWLAAGMWGIAAWNVYVLGLRAWSMGRLLAVAP